MTHQNDQLRLVLRTDLTNEYLNNNILSLVIA